MLSKRNQKTKDCRGAREMKFRDLFATYNPTDGIVGCNEGTLVWFHEDRHKQQFSFRIIRNFYDWGYIFGMIFTIVFQVWFFMIPAFIITMILETDAWVYSIKRIKEKQGCKGNEC